ncbi:acyltransferase [uncultured Methanobrevibacter sp.]|uniref:acyltransferase n=1 Tax=uncultured Methanobrevibacter sp. TaxID=253161 RepID=UPI0025D8279D|nr:acyltransferase family protein [uncultured Methanobrevibacter sp.]
MANKRVFYYDALRALAIFGILACHMITIFITKANDISIHNLDWMYLFFFNSLRQFSIPLFVMISGALLINKDYSLSNFIRKKFNRIFIHYIFWAIVFVLVSFLLVTLGIKTNMISDFSIGYLFKSMIGFTPGFQKGRLFWFIWMILVVYVILFILNKVLYHFNENQRKRIIDILVIVFTIYCLVALPFDLIKLSPYKNFIPYYISFAGYGILGYYLAKTDFSNKLKLSNKALFIISTALFAVLYIYFLVYATGLCAEANKFVSVNYFGILTLLMSSSIFLSFRYFEESYNENENSLFMKIRNGKLGELINSLSRCSFGIYFIHPLVYMFYKDIIFHSIDIANHNPIKWSSLLIVLVIFTSWGIIWIMSKIPYVEKVSGA